MIDFDDLKGDQKVTFDDTTLPWKAVPEQYSKS